MSDTQPMHCISSYFSNVTPKHMTFFTCFISVLCKTKENLVSYSSEHHTMFSQVTDLNDE